MVFPEEKKEKKRLLHRLCFPSWNTNNKLKSKWFFFFHSILSSIIMLFQALTLKPYLNCIHEALDVALCIRYFPSQTIERQSRPEVCFILYFILF